MSERQLTINYNAFASCRLMLLVLTSLKSLVAIAAALHSSHDVNSLCDCGKGKQFYKTLKKEAAPFFAASSLSSECRAQANRASNCPLLQHYGLFMNTRPKTLALNLSPSIAQCAERVLDQIAKPFNKINT